MKIGIIVDGESEYSCLPAIYAQLERLTGHQFLRPLVARVPGPAPAEVIARQCARLADQLSGRGAEKVVVLWDHETRDACPGETAVAIEDAIRRRCGAVAVAVVMKNRTLENWLAADMDALAAQTARFDVTRAARRAVAPNRADSIDALRLIRGLCVRRSYEKVADSVRIMSHASVGLVGAHSRSFRRFLRIVGHPDYASQSRRPA